MEPPHPDAALRHRAQRFEQRVLWASVLALVAWLTAGFFRRPEAGGIERLFVVVLALGLSAVIAANRMFLRVLPALDRTPREATVTGRRTLNAEPDADGDVDPYDLLSVRLDIDGTLVDSHIAEIIARESLDRFTVGSTWTVYAFDGPLTHAERPADSRVILAEAHDDVVRQGYNLVRCTLRGMTGPGSDLLQRRFANDPDPTDR
ncbi:hypothetical protein [Streptomyces profundus]|uniref:hypothetical protein n=1 Tax=Streptomyces profundus TaxID=2867410 RepID=UPI001D16B193|nr:hypothetical protein [Streptomyces sp. MA3_2.13]UED86633.1 hypothetical protein K4G22_22560 [Streptomyces sp. MA3_2.13]